MGNDLYVFAMLSLLVVLAEVLVKKTFLRILGTSLLVILLAAIVANLGIIPTTSEKAPVYDWIFSVVAPLAIFLILLRVHLRSVLKAGAPMILMFFVGSAGTIVGILLGMYLIDGRQAIGESYRALGGMYTGTYIGGSVNFNAIALHYNVVKNGTLFAGATAVDNIVTTIWMLMCLALPPLLNRWKRFRVDTRLPDARPLSERGSDAPHDDTETVHPIDLGLLLATGLITILFSDWLAEKTHIPSILILTTVALILAQFRFVKNMSGSHLLGMFGLNLFLAVIGAFCDLKALLHIGSLGLSLLILVVVTVGVHGLLIFAVGTFLRKDHYVTAVASQACIGGPTSALAIARAMGRSDLALPAILIGALGYAIGTYLGFWVAEFLLR